MNQDVTIAILSYTIVMLLANIVKDIIIKRNIGVISKKHISKSNNRWWIAYTIGIIILFLVYGRAGP